MGVHRSPEQATAQGESVNFPHEQLISASHKVKLPLTMPNIENTQVSIKNNDGKTTVGQMQTTWFNQGDRLKRALQRLGFFWLLAGVTLFIPIAHFVLVPGFLIAGPVVSYLTYQMCWMRDHVSGSCPACNEQITIKLESKDKLPKWTYCPACNTPLHITQPDNHPEN